MRKLAASLSLIFILSVPLLGGKNLADYTLQVQVLKSLWQRHNGSFEGWGRGVVKDGQNVRGFDFTYGAPEHFMRTIGKAHYLGKWKKEPLKMEILVGEIGSKNKYRTYDLKTSVRDDVYVPGPHGAIAVSQEEYKAKWMK
jgi:hypothetical protein